jgi:hypothetical protein
MKTTRITAAAVLIVGTALTLHVALSQQPGIKRTDLQRHDLSAPRTEFASQPGDIVALEDQRHCDHK